MNQRSLNVEFVVALQEITNNVPQWARLADRLTANIEDIGRRLDEIERGIAHLEGIEDVAFRPRP